MGNMFNLTIFGKMAEEDMGPAGALFNIQGKTKGFNDLLEGAPFRDRFL